MKGKFRTYFNSSNNKRQIIKRQAIPGLWMEPFTGQYQPNAYNCIMSSLGSKLRQTRAIRAGMLRIFCLLFVKTDDFIAPDFIVCPSIITASHSTSPDSFRHEPRPALKWLCSSKTRIAFSTASTAVPPWRFDEKQMFH